MQRLFLTLLIAASATAPLTGCDLWAKTTPVHSEPKEPAPRYAILGVDLSLATKSSITRALNQENIPYRSNMNKWEEIWEPGTLMQGAKQIRLGFTEGGKMAYFQYDFNEDFSNEQLSNLLKASTTQYGNPSSEDGILDSAGEYTATWDMGDGMRVTLHRKYPSNSVHLTYFNDPVFSNLTLEYKLDALREIEHKQTAMKLLH